MARVVVALALSALLAGATLSGCGSPSAGTLATQACTKVERSIGLFNHAAYARTPARAAADRRAALIELRAALPLAAIAAGDDGTFQGLEATLSESNRVPEFRLIHALSAQCAAIDQET
jgi:hypothetical protein